MESKSVTNETFHSFSAWRNKKASDTQLNQPIMYAMAMAL